MNKQLLLLSSLCVLLTACDTTKSPKATSNVPMERTGTSADSSMRADNTGRNARDRSEHALTAGDQSENEVDRTITQRIRQAVMDDDSLSTNAKNIKIITIRGVVTLRGPVNNDREKNEIAKKAKAVNGVRSVDNQIEVNRTDHEDGNPSMNGMRSDAMRNDRDMNR